MYVNAFHKMDEHIETISVKCSTNANASIRKCMFSVQKEQQEFNQRIEQK